MVKKTTTKTGRAMVKKTAAKPAKKTGVPRGPYRKKPNRALLRFEASFAPGTPLSLLARLGDEDAIKARELLRAVADELPREAKGGQGPAPRFESLEVAIEYAFYRFKPMTHGEVIAKLADECSVSGVAIEKRIKPYRAAAFALWGEFGLGDGKDPGNSTKQGANQGLSRGRVNN